MAVTGSEPVSVGNLAAAIGAEVSGTDEFGQRPVCVDNLKAVMREMSGQKLVEYVILDNGNSESVNVNQDPTSFKLLIIYIEYEGIYGRDPQGPIVLMNPKNGSTYADGYSVTLTATTVSANLQTDWVIKKIRAFK